MEIYNSVNEIIGKTPILKADRYKDNVKAKADLFIKLEALNPCGSAKDRVALNIINEAIAAGKLLPGGTVVEATSGNTGIGLAAISTAMGYKCIIVMPDTMSKERQALISAYGSKLILTPGSLGMNGAIAKAKEIVAETDNAIEAGQFINSANPKAHYKTTGPEIYKDMDGKIDVFVAGIGTGGTITGVGQYLKEQDDNVEIIAVEPMGSAVLSGENAGPHKIQGIGAGFVPEILDTTIYNKVIKIANEEAYEEARRLGKTEGVLVGISSGAALAAALKLAKLDEYKDKNIVVFAPDTGDRYLSTDLFAEK